MLRIAVLDDYSGCAESSADWAKLSAEVSFFDKPLGSSIAEILEPFEVICLMRERTVFPAELIEQLPNLRLIVTTGPRNLAIDVEAARRRGVTVCGTRSRKTTTSELTMSLMLTLSRRLIPEVRGLACGEWQGRPGRDLADLTLGLVGLGNIGQQMARLGSAFGMRVSAWSPNLTEARADDAGVTRAPSLQALAESSDVLSLHMVLSERTRGLIGGSVFTAMPEGSIFLNTSRAGLIDREALFSGLRAYRPYAAGIDVFEEEPLALSDPWQAASSEFGDRLLLTPHLGYVTEATWKLFYQDTVEAITAFHAGRPIRML